jgi:hypothetical protein
VSVDIDTHKHHLNALDRFAHIVALVQKVAIGRVVQVHRFSPSFDQPQLVDLIKIL